MTTSTGSSKKNLAKFGDTCFVRADWLCMGCPRLVGGRRAGNSNMKEFFLHHAVLARHVFPLSASLNFKPLYRVTIENGRNRLLT